MKKILCLFLVILFVIPLTGCGDPLKKSEGGAKAVALMPYYLGDGEDDAFYEFKPEEFKVLITYADVTTAEMTEGFTVSTSTGGGYFYVTVEWNGLSGDAFFPIGKEAYQTYKAEMDRIAAEAQKEVESMEAENQAMIEDIIANAPETDPAA